MLFTYPGIWLLIRPTGRGQPVRQCVKHQRGNQGKAARYPLRPPPISSVKLERRHRYMPNQPISSVACSAHMTSRWVHGACSTTRRNESWFFATFHLLISLSGLLSLIATLTWVSGGAYTWPSNRMMELAQRRCPRACWTIATGRRRFRRLCTSSSRVDSP